MPLRTKLLPKQPRFLVRDYPGHCLLLPRFLKIKINQPPGPSSKKQIRTNLLTLTQVNKHKLPLTRQKAKNNKRQRPESNTAASKPHLGCTQPSSTETDCLKNTAKSASLYLIEGKVKHGILYHSILSKQIKSRLAQLKPLKLIIASKTSKIFKKSYSFPLIRQILIPTTRKPQCTNAAKTRVTKLKLRIPAVSIRGRAKKRENRGPKTPNKTKTKTQTQLLFATQTQRRHCRVTVSYHSETAEHFWYESLVTRPTLANSTRLAEDLQTLLLETATPIYVCLLYTSPSPRDRQKSRMPSSA